MKFSVCDVFFWVTKLKILLSRPVGILPRHEGSPGGGAGWLDVVLLQQDALRCQLLQAGAVDVGVVPGHIVPPCRGEVEIERNIISFPT